MSANMGRPLSKKRHAQGAHLAKLRQQAGLTQTRLAELIGERQQAVAYWETADHPPRSDALPKIAAALGVTVEEILGVDSHSKKKPGPPSRAQKLIEEISALPRGQQEKLFEVVTALISQYKRPA